MNETTDTLNPRTTEAGVAWLDWREQLRTQFLDILDALQLDAMVWPVNGAAAPLRERGLPGSANNLPLVQGVINILGAPGVIMPAGQYADGTPFGVIFIGRFWDEANLLGLAYDYEQASAGTLLARVVPTLVPEPSGVAMVLLLACCRGLRRRRQAA